MTAAMVDAFVAELPRDADGSEIDGETVRVRLEHAWKRASAHGSYGIAPAAWAAHVARRIGAPADLETTAVDDLLLALACLEQHPDALAGLLARTGPVIDRMRIKSGLDLDPAEFRQQIFVRVLVCDERGPPRLASYRGRGPIEGWISLVAARYAVDLRRRRSNARPDAPLDLGLLGDPADPGGPELIALRTRYRDLFRDAFRRALGELDDRERVALRLRYVHGMSVTEVARLQNVHRVTMSRSLTALRARILQSVIAHIAAQENIAPDDVESALRLVESRLDLSLTMLED